MTRWVLIGAVVWFAACGPDGEGADAGSAELFDPLSMPQQPTVSLDAFTPAAVCGECHVEHYAQWRTSMHAYSLKDPVYRAIVGLRQDDFDGLQDRFCLQCHTAIGTRGGDITRNFSFDELQPITLEGITCEACHKVSGIERTYNSGHALDPAGPIRGPIADPVASGFHASEYSELFEQSEFCGGCHDVVEVSGLNLERPYEEWLESSGRVDGQTCQICHMPEYSGSAVDGAPERTLHEHRWVGVDVPLSDGFLDEDQTAELITRIETLLSGAAALTVEASPTIVAGERLDVFVTIENLITAHNLPTGSTFNRQVWLELTVTDADDQVVYRTGDLDANGDLRDHFSELDPYGDSDLITLGSKFVDGAGAPQVLSWRAAEHTSSSLSPGYFRTFTLFVPTTETTPGPLAIEARLRFRSFPPFLLRLLGLGDRVDRLPIFELATAVAQVDVVP